MVRRMPTRTSRRPTAGRPLRPRRNLLSAAGLDDVTYRDVEVLRTLLSDRGRIRPRRITGLTPQQQRRAVRAIKTARELALLPYAGRR